MANKDYHQIMTEITSQLTGNTEEDIRYLTAKCEEYKTHEMAKEILRGIGRIMYDIIPEDKREEINQAINNDSLGWKAALDEVNFCIYKKDFYKAREILESLISKLEDADMYADDEITVYKDFNETFEDVLFLHRCRSEKKEKVLKGAGYDIDEILEAEGISPFADRDVLGLAGSLANNCVANEQWQAAEYFLEIFYDLTDDDEAEKELAKVRRKIAGEEEPLYS